MRIRFGALAAATIFLAAFTASASADILINVDKSTQRMTVSVDGTPRYVWPVSTGGPHYDTPSGSFKPNRMDKDHHSEEYDNAPMPYAMFFDDKGHAVHGTYEKSIGRAVSHGCVRLSVAHAATLWSLVKDQGMNHTQVVLNGHIPNGDVLVAKRNDAGQPLQIDPEQNQNDDGVTGSVPQDDTYSRNSDNANNGYYAAQAPRYDDGPRYADRQPYYARRDYRDDDRPAPFPFFLFGR
jgi:hypothetical protein